MMSNAAAILGMVVRRSEPSVVIRSTVRAIANS